MLLINLFDLIKWCIFQRRLELTAVRKRSTLCTRFLSTNPAKLPSLLSENVVTTGNKKVLVAKLSQCSVKRQRTPRRSFSSSNAQRQRARAIVSSNVQRLLSSVSRRRPRVRLHSETSVLKFYSKVSLFLTSLPVSHNH